METRKKIFGLAAIFSSMNLLAGSIDYLSQQDAEYMAHPAMVGKIGVSGAYYNPAGTAFLEDGLYIQLNNQTHLKKYTMTVDGRKFESDKASPVVPSFQLVKKNGNNAFFFHTGAIAGGGTVEYKGGIGRFQTMTHQLDFGKILAPTLGSKLGNFVGQYLGTEYIDGSTIHGKSYYVGIQGGFTRKISDSWSLALGVRFINAERKLRGHGNFGLNLTDGKGKKVAKIGEVKYDINSERSAMGVTGIIGVNYHPNDKFNLGFRYETETRLNFETKERNIKNGINKSLSPIKGILGSILGNSGTILGNKLTSSLERELASDKVIKEWTDKQKGKRNLPAMAAIGMAYKVTDRTTLLTSGNYYFIKEAGDDFGAYNGYDNGYEISFGLDYELTEKWTLMTGYQYTNTGANEKTYKDTDYALDANMYSIGAKYKYSENLAFMGSYSYVDYKTATGVDEVTYKKHIDAFGIAMTYKF